MELRRIKKIDKGPVNKSDHRILNYVSFFDGECWVLGVERYASWWSWGGSCEKCHSLVLIKGALLKANSEEELNEKYKDMPGYYVSDF